MVANASQNNPMPPAQLPDLELIAQRIALLAQLATEEHLRAMRESQAAGLLAMQDDVRHNMAEASGLPAACLDRLGAFNA